MFFELTDHLTCPRCGPAYGLILLALDVDARRVRSGWLGCPNCRVDYPIEEGVADLRIDRQAVTTAPNPVADEELALKTAALSGLTEGRGYVLLGERLTHAAPALADLLPGLEVIAIRSTPDDSRERPGVSRLLCEIAFPLAEYRLEAAAVAPGGDAVLVREAARRVKPDGRLVLFDADERDIEELERAGLTLAAHEGGTAVAERRVEPLPGGK